MTTGVAETGVQVFFIDYGNYATVSLDEIYQLPLELLSIKMQVRARLAVKQPGGDACPMTTVVAMGQAGLSLWLPWDRWGCLSQVAIGRAGMLVPWPLWLPWDACPMDDHCGCHGMLVPWMTTVVAMGCLSHGHCGCH
jgi:hypothetical protein